MASVSITPRLSPSGHLRIWESEAAPALDATLAASLTQAFDAGTGSGLLLLGGGMVGRALPPDWGWWRDYAARYVVGLCAAGAAGAEAAALPAPDDEQLDALIADAPPLLGADYLDAPALRALWRELGDAVGEALRRDGRPLPEFLKAMHPAWNLVGRVCFNLAENRRDPEAPFAFLVTYTSSLSAHGKAQHLPLSRALAEFSGRGKQAQLLSLLKPVQAAAEQCDWLRRMVDDGEIYHPLRWQPQDAWRFLLDVPKLEAAGIVVRAPGTWAGGRPPRPAVSARVGAQAPSLLGMNALLDFRMSVTLDGEAISAADIQSLLAGGDGLQMIRGHWVEVDSQRLARLLQRFRSLEQQAGGEGGLPFADAMRLLAGAGMAGDETADPAWAHVDAGPWLSEILRGMRSPEGLARVHPGASLKAELRPYQEAGVRWLYLLQRLGLGACLADDMGLGKTIQVLSLLLILKRESTSPRPSLLVAPASLLANWAAEAARFAPELRVLIAHPSVLAADELRALSAQRIAEVDLVVTSYGSLSRQPLFTEHHWRLAVIDEAQAIKNPGARQTRQVKAIKADTRIALTGTPVENRLSDLWSIFDFTHPGLLGGAKAFADFGKRLAQAGHYGPLKNLVSPYILRRLKTDKRVIADLPDKTELTAWCHLSPAQAALYQRTVGELEHALATADGVERKGLVLAYLMRFKQICNHPSQWLGDGAWRADDSGKFGRLRALVEIIAAKQEKLLVFTQFRETTEPLAAFLGGLFGREGLVLHGGTPVAKRRELVKRFQEDEQSPFFVLSLKAGGAGLNLTAAAHVIHFDRWWNPAVENQATDRAYRIGQKKNVLVHKFVCRGTVEERIDQLIESKKQLVTDLLDGGAELRLTEMSDRELLNLVKLDINSAQEN